MSEVTIPRPSMRLSRLLDSLLHLRTVALRRSHEYFWDAWFRKYEACATSGFVHMRELYGASYDQRLGYLPTPRLVLTWAISGLGIDPSRFNFIDIGSGRGRAVLHAARLPFARAIGLELSGKLSQEAEANLAAYPKSKLKCADVEMICGDAAEFELPDGDCIAYFFNPFRAELTAKVMSGFVRQSIDKGQRLIIVYHNPVCLDVVEAMPELRPRKLKGLQRMLLRLFSPYPVRVFELDPALVCGKAR